MKRILSIVLILILSLSVLVACGGNDEHDFTNAKGALKDYYGETLYPTTNAAERETRKDFSVIKQLMVSGQTYTVAWSTNSDAVKVAEYVPTGDNDPLSADTANTIDVPDSVAEDLHYVLTATITSPDGKSSTKVELKLVVPAVSIVTIPEALAAEEGTTVAVRGTVESFYYEWSAQYNNCSVYIRDENGNKLLCFRLATKVEIGDKILVTGEIDKYNGVNQIAEGCTAIIEGHEDVVITYEQVSIADALASADGRYVEISGTVVSIYEAWNEDYGNISVYIEDSNGTYILVYRLKTNVVLGDVITVKGAVGSHEGSKQIAKGASAEKTGHDDSVTVDKGYGQVEAAAVTVVTAPTTGTAYKFGLVHGGKNNTQYFFDGQNYTNNDGRTFAWYLNYTDDIAGSVDVYLEAVDGVSGGYRLYFMDGTTKTYIRMYQDAREGKDTLGTLELTTDIPEEYFTFNTEYNTLIWTNATGNANYMGTSGTYTSISASHIDYITNTTSYIAHLYTVDAAE